MNAELESRPSQAGRIFQISTSPGGVPKRGQTQGEVESQGIAGDRQTDLQSHGGPDRALCLFSLERILALQAEGHPVFPGAIGENLTLSGLDWAQVVPGVRMQLGNEVLIEISSYTVPCDNLRPFFTGQNFSRVSQKRHPGWSRLYARVLRGGLLRIGDAVRIV